MFANYHTHTWRCQHARGTEKEYVENAIRGGLKILGFSDHTPMPYPEGHVSNVKMRLDQLEGYVDTVLGLKQEYADQIDIRLGLEVEYYPAYFDELLEITGQYPIEYFLLGQHFLGNEIGEAPCGDPTADEKRLERYCSQSLEALRTGCFTYFAHPDVLNFTGEGKIYDRCMRGLCQGARELGIPLEINFLGIRTKRHYPNERFWEIAGQEKNQVVFGSDAHGPATVWDSESIAVAERMVQRYGLKLTDTVAFRRPGKS